MHHDALVHRIQPLVHLGEDLQFRFLWEAPLRLRKGNLDFHLFREGQIDREYRARFFPLRLPRAFRSSWSRDIQRCRRLVHGCVTTQSQGPCKNRTATALRPSLYRTPTTAASVGRPPPVASIRRRSSNSSGKVERKIACSGPPNSTIAASRRLVLPPREAVTSTGIRTALACGKNRANRSAQSGSFAMSVRLPDSPTSPLALRPKIHGISRSEAHHALRETQTSEDRDARWKQKNQKRSAVASCRHGEA